MIRNKGNSRALFLKLTSISNNSTCYLTLISNKRKTKPTMEGPSTLQPLRSHDSEHADIPIEFSYPIHPMNQIERSLVSDIKHLRKGTKNQECRICLESDQDRSKLIVPCKCTGSIQVTHQHCLIEWIKRRVENEPKKKARCEVCDSQFNYKLANQRNFDCNEITKHYNRDKKGLICFFAVYGTFVVFFFGLLGIAVAAKSSETFMSGFMQSGGGTTIIVSILVIYFVALLVVTILFISEYLVREDVIISQVFKYTEPKSFIKNYKIYFKR